MNKFQNKNELEKSSLKELIEICQKDKKIFKGFAKFNKKTDKPSLINHIVECSTKKINHGQFYTTNYKYILQNMKIPEEINTIIEPFAGTRELLNFIEDKKKYNIELYDINPQYKNIKKRDTLKNPPDYDNKFILTNPPYLARNKSNDKTLYDKYNCNDLYKCFIINIINSKCIGGIIIIPLNFMSSIRKSDIELRKNFLEKYNIHIINIFEESVFNDTNYSVCTVYFLQKKEDNIKTKLCIYPSKTTLNTSLDENNNYTIGGEIYNLVTKDNVEVERATKLSNNENITNILLKCIDDNINSQLGLSLVSDEERDKYIDKTDKLSARSYATLNIIKNNKVLTEKQQKKLVGDFNKFIKDYRNKYNSLFLSNYRESNSIARKRISFDLAYKLCNHILTC